MDYLLNHARQSEDVEHLCWASIALARYLDGGVSKEDLSNLESRIVDAMAGRKATNYVRELPVRVALATLALAGGQNAFFQLSGLSNPESVVQRLPTVAHDCRNAQTTKVSERTPWREVSGHGHRSRGPPSAASRPPLRCISPRSRTMTPTWPMSCSGNTSISAQGPAGRQARRPKPNLVEYHRDKVINTNPHVVAAVIELCQREGRRRDHRRRRAGTLAQRRIPGQRQRPGRRAQALQSALRRSQSR